MTLKEWDNELALWKESEKEGQWLISFDNKYDGESIQSDKDWELFYDDFGYFRGLMDNDILKQYSAVKGLNLNELDILNRGDDEKGFRIFSIPNDKGEYKDISAESMRKELIELGLYEKEPELTKETELTPQVENKESPEVLEDEYDIDDKYQKYLDSLPKEERERLEQEALEIALAEEAVKEKGKGVIELSDEEVKRRAAISDEINANLKKTMDEINANETKQGLAQEKTQEEIDLEYSLAKMKQDLSQSQEEKQEQEVDLTYPAQKREFLNETLEIVDKGITPNIKESLEILDKLDEVEAQIAKKEKEINAEQEKDSSSPSKTILDSEIDEALQRQQQEQQELHQKELESLQKEKETLEKNFQASIENLIKQGDVKDLLKNLQTLDEAFAKFLKKTKEECDLLAKQRIEKLELAMQNENVKEAVSGFVKELHANREEVNKQSKELESQKECFEALQKQQQKCLKGDEKSMSDARFELGQNLVWLNETHPTFKDNYPKFYKELEQTLKEPQKQKEKQQENSRERSA